MRGIVSIDSGPDVSMCISVDVLALAAWVRRSVTISRSCVVVRVLMGSIYLRRERSSMLSCIALVYTAMSVLS